MFISHLYFTVCESPIYPAYVSISLFALLYYGFIDTLYIFQILILCLLNIFFLSVTCLLQMFQNSSSALSFKHKVEIQLVNFNQKKKKKLTGMGRTKIFIILICLFRRMVCLTRYSKFFMLFFKVQLQISDRWPLRVKQIFSIKLMRIVYLIRKEC